jgi:ABC-type sugar transport system substrate-binding protein
MKKRTLQTILVSAALLQLSGEVMAEDAKIRTDLVIADLGQPETNPWVINRHRFEGCVADALGVELKEFDDQNSEEKHVAQAESIIASQPDGLIFNPLTAPAGIQVARLLEENDIPGVAVGRLVVSNYDNDYKGEDFVAQVTQNNATWGEAMGRATVELGYKKVAMIWTQKGNISATEIWEGVARELEVGGVEVVAESWDVLSRENGQKYAEQYIARFAPGEVDAFIVIGAVAGLGSKFAIDQAGREDIAVITTDIDEQVAQFIKEGELEFSIGGHWMVGGFGLIQLYDYLHGHPVTDTQPQVGLIPVTSENVETYANSLLKGCILSPETIRSLSKVHNPDANLSEFINNWQANWQKHVQ